MAFWLLLWLVAFARGTLGVTVTAGPTANTTASNAPTGKATDATTHLASSDPSPAPGPSHTTGDGNKAGNGTAVPAATTSPASSKELPLTSQVAESATLGSTATARPSDAEPPLSQKPGLVAIICIFVAILLIGAVVILVKCCRSREPAFKKLDEVPMGKVAEDSPFARYPPK